MKHFAVGVALLLAAVSAPAATQLTYTVRDQPLPLYWASGAFPLQYIIGSATIDTLPGSVAAIEAGFRSWHVPDTTIAFENAGVSSLRAGRDQKNAVTLNDDLFESSGFIAYTTTWFDENSGALQEVDIQLDPTAIRGNYNLESVVRHEVGHLLGFDHSAIVSAAMFPYLSADDPQTLDSDDRIAATTLYGNGAGSGTALRGRVANGHGAIFGAHVVAIDSLGTPVASTLSAEDGTFALRGLPAGTYTLYAEPLDGPVEVTNLSGMWRGGKSHFRTEFTASKSVSVAAGESREGIALDVNELPINLNPKWIGAFAPGSNQMPLSSTMQKIRAGQRVNILVGGDGIVSGVTTFDISSAGFKRVSNFNYGSNYLWAEFEIAHDAPATSVVVVVRDGDEVATLTGAIVVEPATGGAARRRGVRP